MNITIVSLDNWGFNEYIKKTLQAEGHQVVHINFNAFKYKYPNLLHKIGNFFYKNLFNKNLKHEYYGSKILEKLAQNPIKQDVLLTLKGDFIDPNSLKLFKNYTNQSIAFFNDNIKRYPNIKNVISCFDEVYSFEKKDCQNHNLKFVTNFIYETNLHASKIEITTDLFNISSAGKRDTFLQQIAENLNKNKVKFKFIIFDKNKSRTNSLIEITNQPISLEEVNNLIKQSKTLLDIHREGQDGLTFRVFESLGLQKKLITTNKDIANYDFYNPSNILIIDFKNPVIQKSFFETPYVPVPSQILNTYTIKGWVENVILKHDAKND